MNQPVQVAYAAVICNDDFAYGNAYCCGGQVLMSEAEYNRQTSRPNNLWQCPQCGGSAEFDNTFWRQNIS